MNRAPGTSPKTKEKKNLKQAVFGVWRYFTSQTKEIQSEDLSTDDVIIAMIGPTGTGKSSFIEAATGYTGIVGHSLESYTTGVSVFKLSFPELVDSDICFIDTPGFDDTLKPDDVIFRQLSDWILSTYKRKIQLTSLLYFHRISDVRMSGNLLRNLRYFKDLCGETEFDKIILTTTMWNEVDKETGLRREEELVNKYWKSMTDRGSTVRRFHHNRDSAFEILAPVFEKVNEKSGLFLQKELKDLEGLLGQTEDRNAKFRELAGLISRHQKAVQTIRSELQRRGSDQGLQEYIAEQRNVCEELRRIIGEIQHMNVPIGTHINNTVKEMDWKRILGVYVKETREGSPQTEKVPLTEQQQADQPTKEDHDHPNSTPDWTAPREAQSVSIGLRLAIRRGTLVQDRGWRPKKSQSTILVNNDGPRTPDDYLQLGIDYHQANQLQESFRCFERSATEGGGCGFGMLMYGLALRHGWGNPKNEELGFKWIRKAAEGAVDDLEKIRNGRAEIYSASAQVELVLAIYELGQCFFHGWGVAQDQKMAVSYYTVAARLGDMDAQADLGYCLANGKGCRTNKREAARWYRAAVQQGHSDIGLVWIYKDKYQ